MEALTERQHEVLRFIYEQKRDRGIPPVYREIGEHFGWSSSHSAYVHVEALERKGCVTKAVGTTRTIQITEAGFEALGVQQRACEHGGGFMDLCESCHNSVVDVVVHQGRTATQLVRQLEGRTEKFAAANRRVRELEAETDRLRAQLGAVLDTIDQAARRTVEGPYLSTEGYALRLEEALEAADATLSRNLRRQRPPCLPVRERRISVNLSEQVDETRVRKDAVRRGYQLSDEDRYAEFADCPAPDARRLLDEIEEDRQ